MSGVRPDQRAARVSEKSLGTAWLAAAWPVVLLTALTLPLRVQAQDTVQIGALHAAALAHDPRSAMPAVMREASALREQDLATARRLQSSVHGQATYQSDVTSFPITLPGTTVPEPPYARFQITLDLEHPLYDAGAVAAQRTVERARLEESTSDVRTQLHRLKLEVNSALFTVLLMQERIEALDLARGDLDQRLLEARARVVDGSALGRDTSAIVAEGYRLEESRSTLDANRRAALVVLGALTGETFDASRPLAIGSPDAVANASQMSGDVVQRALAERVRPEFAKFDATRARLNTEVDALSVANRPRVSAFAQGGVGRPGLNQLVRDTDPFYLAGIRASWQPFERGKIARREEILRAQQRLADLEEHAFTEGLARATATDLAELERLDAADVRDQLLVTARADVERIARVQFEEGAATAAAWVSARADLLDAQLQIRLHAVERAYAQVRLLTTLGVPVR